MSAFAAEAALVVTCRSARSPLPSITARPSAAEKIRFARLADAAGMSESALALVAIRAVLDSDCHTSQEAVTAAARESSTDRITIRLRPGDGAAIARRAAQRGMRASTYLAALTRAHLRANPPLPASELAALKQSITVLAALGRFLVETSRNPALVGTERDDFRQQLSRTRTALATLERHTHDLVRAALISWETRSE